MNTYYVELNFSGSNTIDTGIAVSQGDYGKVQLSIACKKDGQFISDAESAEIIFQTEKGKVINGDLTGSGGLYGYVFQGNELQDPGKLVATVTLHYEDGQTSSESFLMAVRYNPLYDQNLQAGPYITQLEKLQAQAQGYVDYIGAIIEQLRQDIGETALTKADLQNDFLQSAPGLKALDAALGPQILQKSNVVNNLLATVTGNVLDATQGKALNEKITQLYSKLTPVKRNLIWQSTVSEIGASYSLRFGNWVYIHAGFITVSGLSNGNDLTMLIDSGAMQVTPNISAISNKGEIGVFRISETNLQAGGTIPSGQIFVLDLIIPLQP